VAIGSMIWLVGRRWRGRRVRRLVAVGSLVLLVAVGVGGRGAGRVVEWFGDLRDLQSRAAAWQDGWSVVRDFPLAGTGMNTYSTTMLFYQRSNPDLHVAQAHNDYLQLLAEGGLLVAVPALIAVSCLVAAIQRNLHAARHETRGYWIRAGAAIGLVAMAVQEIAEFGLQIPANAFLFCTLAAVALAPADGSA
jgi:O-antigen ligase